MLPEATLPWISIACLQFVSNDVVTAESAVICIADNIHMYFLGRGIGNRLFRLF